MINLSFTLIKIMGNLLEVIDLDRYDFHIYDTDEEDLCDTESNESLDFEQE